MAIEAIKMLTVKSQQIKNIAFRGEASPAQIPQQGLSEDTVEISEDKKGMSTNQKYAIGGVIVAALVTLGILGYKGKLGEGLQKFLGGAKKAGNQAAEEGEKAGGKAAGVVENAAGNASSKADGIADEIKVTLESVNKEIEKVLKAEKTEDISKGIKGLFENIEKLSSEEQEKALLKIADDLDNVDSKLWANLSDDDISLVSNKLFETIKKEAGEAGPKSAEEVVEAIKKNRENALKKLEKPGSEAKPSAAEKPKTGAAKPAKPTLTSVKKDIDNLAKIEDNEAFSSALKELFAKIEKLKQKDQEKVFMYILENDEKIITPQLFANMSDDDLSLLGNKLLEPLKKLENPPKNVDEVIAGLIENRAELKASFAADAAK